MNIGVRVFFRIDVFTFFGYVLRSGISESYGSSNFNIFEETPYCFPKWLISFANIFLPFTRLSFHLVDSFLCCAYNGILFSLKKEGNPAICDNMDEPGRHYAP